MITARMPMVNMRASDAIDEVPGFRFQVECYGVAAADGVTIG
jgi:hypothetical protein